MGEVGRMLLRLLVMAISEGVGSFDDAKPHVKVLFQGKAGYLNTPLDHYMEHTIEDHFRKFKNSRRLRPWSEERPSAQCAE